jgi:hypothetical protein
MIDAPMNESDARQVLLVRALETPPGIPQWQEEDRDWASRTAASVTGERASTEQFVARRAALAIERLETRTPSVRRALDGLAWRAWVTPVLMVAAFLVGLVADAASADRRINILAPPLLMLLVWNLVVYLLIAGSWAVALVRGRTDETAPFERRSGPIARRLSRLAGATLGNKLRGAPAPLVRFVADWMRASAPLTAARSHACLHWAAAALACGALAGLYARGLAFQYLAGWDSTFLDVATVRRLLGMALGPASLITGLPLPDVGHLETLRFSAGPGENAGRWIHLQAVTIGLFVIAPRVALAVVAGWRATRMAQRFPLSLAEPYFRGLERRHRGVAARVQIVPYSFTLPDSGRRALERLLGRVYGDDTVVEVAPPIALGDEDGLALRWRPDPGATLVTALFSASATPENETHGAFLAELGRAVAGTVPLAIVVDESAFRRRFGAGSERVDSRRQAWRKLVEARTGSAPLAVSLDPQAGDESAEAMRRLIEEISGRLGQNPGLVSRDATASAGTAA